ncbi:MAG: HAD hydrolase-like protein [Desulfurococcaceae archaeon]
MRLRLLILDYDLTLLDTIADFYDAFNGALRACGGEPVGSLGEFVEHVARDELEALIPAGADRNGFWRLFRSLYRTRAPIPREGALDLLRTAKALGLAVVVVTGRGSHPLAMSWELSAAGLSDYVDEVHTLQELEAIGAKEGFPFDKSSVIAFVLRGRGVLPGEAVYVGDYWSDYESARRAGVRFIGVAYGAGDARLRRRGAEIVVGNLREAALVVAAMWAGTGSRGPR